ncbi:methyltransferase domain-containing protein [Nocardioides sp. TF02-7]|uniref:class I SAM-dependent methyltransferase n=1 Tax=Nocardioides sp. TF02-7 TaxID=2917724 RepID=UPI001F06FA42|nr:methyltransferase domain-containing protein [Nocardioides sp. TF02-7]UMG93161.1 methyltransferase domain-containing protein [Nocardioides sp. TF02-7]
MDLFAGAAAYYDRFRSEVPDEVVRLLTADLGNRRGRLLDLGTGTGMVVAALAAAFDDVIAVDPDPAMLEQAKVHPDARDVTWVRARAEDFSPPDGWGARPGHHLPGLPLDGPGRPSPPGSTPTAAPARRWR